MKKKKFLVSLCYLFLLAGCLGIVLLVGKMAGKPLKDETDPTTELILETESEKEQEATPSDAEEEATAGWEEAYRTWRYKTKTVPRFVPEETIPEEEPPYIPPTLMLASDLHYFSSTLHDEGEAFQKMVKADDGKAIQYSDVLIDALLAEAVEKKPSALILSGDITLNGEAENHRLLAQKLRGVQEAGVPVLVIPGNHDMNNRNAASYFGKERKEEERIVTGEEFVEIYHEFGYDQAISRDTASLSYVYPLDETHWMIMLDSCQYETRNHVNGKLKPETMAWLEVQLEQASQAGIFVLPVAHHNLLLESRLYPTECTMENYPEIIKLLADYKVPLFFSGHLHAQRIKKHQMEPGIQYEDAITEIVLSPYTLSPNQYGYLRWDEADNLYFDTYRADVAGYAAAQGSTDENLLDFASYGEAFLKKIIRDQVSVSIHLVPDDLKEEMAGLYADLYFDYCAGKRLSWDKVRAERSYKLWQRVMPDSDYVKKMGQMLEDVREDLQDWKKVDSTQ